MLRVDRIMYLTLHGWRGAIRLNQVGRLLEDAQFRENQELAIQQMPMVHRLGSTSAHQSLPGSSTDVPTVFRHADGSTTVLQTYAPEEPLPVVYRWAEPN